VDHVFTAEGIPHIQVTLLQTLHNKVEYRFGNIKHLVFRDLHYFFIVLSFLLLLMRRLLWLLLRILLFFIFFACLLPWYIFIVTFTVIFQILNIFHQPLFQVRDLLGL